MSSIFLKTTASLRSVGGSTDETFASRTLHSVDDDEALLLLGLQSANGFLTLKRFPGLVEGSPAKT